MKDTSPSSKIPSKKRWLLTVPFLILLLALIWQAAVRNDKIAVSKGGPALESMSQGEFEIDQALARQIARSSERTSEILDSGDLGFLYAYPLGEIESRQWANQGCLARQCSQATFYDFDTSGTLEVIIDMESGEVIDYWRVQDARPGASLNSIPRALAIAADNDEVRQVLGDIRQVEAMMAPMSTWLSDNSCSENWCVDLTFVAPDGTGRIFHVIIDLELDSVSRTFFTRGRPVRDHQEQLEQRDDFSDGCHEQYGWELCWEMTAHDGVNIFNAAFEGTPVFSSAKIGQVEVFYPSWPGGYRDEIGYAASVRPHYGTEVVDLGNGFEIRQLFTEFLRWPNCICCYRYEQIMRFFADGSYEADFISHGPGCDDLSNYRPFWRINLAGVQDEADRILVWESDQWAEAETETRLPVFDGLSPLGEILYTFQESGTYRWLPEFTDPLGRDEAWLFLLNHDEAEGDGPIATGPADTFWPPGLWLDDEIIAGDNPVLWYVPILKTIQNEPYWCMPDPEPDYSPCNAALRAEAVSKIIRPTPTSELDPRLEFLPEIAASATITPITSPSRTPEPSLTPAAGGEAVSTRTPRPIAGEDPQAIILNSGCGSCHKIGSLGEAGKVGPDLSNIGVEAEARVPGQTAGEYIRESILNPTAFIAPNCPNGPCMDNIMPSDYRRRLTDLQIQTLVDFLLHQQRQVINGEPTLEAPTQAAEIEATTPAAEDSGVDGRLIAASITIGSIALIMVMAFLIIALLALLRSRGSGSSNDGQS